MARRPAVGARQLRLAQWPEADRSAWIKAQQPAGLFDDLGAGSDWAPATWAKTTKGYGRFLAWLHHHHPTDLALPADVRLSRERIAAYLRHLQETTQGYSAVAYVEDVIRAARILLPGPVPAWLLTLHGNLRARTCPARDKRASLVPVDALIGTGSVLMRRAETTPGWSARRRAVAYRDGLAIALLAYRPMRIKNFARLRLGIELRRQHAGWHVLLAAEDTKTGQPYEAVLPATLTAPLTRYLEVHRPILLSGERHATPSTTDALWVAETGTAWQQGAMSVRIAKTIEHELGRRVPPHLFRDAAATTIAIDAPRNIADAHLILGHGTPAITEKHYIQARSISAGTRHQAMLADLRANLQTRETEEIASCAP